MELQAVGRTLRLGQAEHVSIVRYIMRDTVEDVSLGTLTNWIHGSQRRQVTDTCKICRATFCHDNAGNCS
ncbi:hypothetical protein CKAH01_13634 [Colletotrichum kahawae]|uniref:Uncharacterized protein n=1 Tax=Colletotrichum kahawae TaxID=34407 RepID=A0AAE0D9L8_COLKA|nr:hypothetical protein CKAH01_13634 [Colletotrichum kahawae]